MLENSPWAFSFPVWAISTLSAFPYLTNAPIYSSSLWSSVGLAPVCVSLVLGIPEQDKVFQVWPHQGQVEAKDCLLGPPGNSMSYCSSGKPRILSNQGSNNWPSWLKRHIPGLYSAWYSSGFRVFSCSLNNKNVFYTIMNGSYVIWSLSFK